MKRVYKYALDQDIVDIPIKSKVLHVGIQNGWLYAWVLVDPTINQLERGIRVAGTGHDIDMMGLSDFKGTFLLPNGLVFHVWEYKRTWVQLASGEWVFVKN